MDKAHLLRHGLGQETSPALTLKQRYIRKVKELYDKQDWDSMEELLSRTFDNTAFDDLTGLFNRRMFFVSLRKVILPRMHRKRAVVGQTPPLGSIVYIDLDHFKKVNERFGHAGGDEVLRVFGTMLERKFREDDVVGRLGGDEFVVVAVGLAKADVEARMQSLKKSFALHAWNLPTVFDCDEDLGDLFNFTHDIMEIEHPEQIESLICRADISVLKQKRRRRVGEVRER